MNLFFYNFYPKMVFLSVFTRSTLHDVTPLYGDKQLSSLSQSSFSRFVQHTDSGTKDTERVFESFIQPICSNNLNTVPLGEAHSWFRTVTVLFVWITKRHDRHPIKLLSFCMWKNKSFVQIRSTKPFGKNTQVRCPVADFHWDSEVLICGNGSVLWKLQLPFCLLISSR